MIAVINQKNVLLHFALFIALQYQNTNSLLPAQSLHQAHHYYALL